MTLCRECRYSTIAINGTIRCINSKVIADNAKALARSITSNAKYPGVDATSERDRWRFAPCGKRGKLWEPQGG